MYWNPVRLRRNCFILAFDLLNVGDERSPLARVTLLCVRQRTISGLSQILNACVRKKWLVFRRGSLAIYA